ncbi:MAG TPA: CHASE domain-containing protein [Pyrinomonadaceae bacterium]|nr:CHASE domain-containing protein [Pyrinomonadaceae bacterium]
MAKPTIFDRLGLRLHLGGRRAAPHLILLLGLLFTFLVSLYLSRLAEAQDESRFRGSVEEIDTAIRSRIRTYVALLRAGTGLFAASETVEPNEFNQFIEKIDLRRNYPGVQGIGFSMKLRRGEEGAIIEKMRQSASKQFKIWPEALRDEYHPIIYLQPPDLRNQATVGYDMFSDPVRREAMERARDTGVPAASGRVELVEDTAADLEPAAGFLIYAPVYRHSSQVSTNEQRRSALVGFVFSPFHVDNFFARILGSKKFDVDLRLYDGAEARPESLLHDSALTRNTPNAAYEPHFLSVTTIDLGGRLWTLHYTTNPGFDLVSSSSYIPYTFAAGVFISLLFYFVARSQWRAREAAEHSAAEVRISEGTVRKTLAERELTEQALRESEERYRELVENANDVVYTLDLEGRITSVNKAAELITGYSRDELVGMSLTDVLTADSAEAGKRMLDLKLAGQQRTSYEVDVKAKSGEIVTLEISSRLIFKGDEPLGVQGIARNITSRRRAEEALREADQRALSEYERLLERISSLAQALGNSRDLLTIFRGLRDFTEASVPCDGLFVSLYDPVRDVRVACYGWGDGNEVDTSELPPMPVTTTGPTSRAIRTGEVVITDDYMNAARGHPAIIVGPDNGLRPESSIAVPMAVMGRIVGTIEVQSYEKNAFTEGSVTAMRMAANLTAVAIEDVRLLDRESSARAAAEESNRLKDEFLATVSHELRTPLTAILGWSRMLEAGSLDNEVAVRAIETIRRNAKAQSQIVDDILDVSRIITGNLYLDLQPLELAPIIEAAINVVRPTADAKGIKIETFFDSDPELVSGDANRLQQVIWNLVSNAVKFTPGGGKVTVALKQLSSEMRITVADTGRGVSPDFLPFVFDRFRQADSSTTRQHGGLGLGLAIARHIVEIHGGTIAATSHGEGQGATFTVALPLLDSVTGKRSERLADALPCVNNQASLAGLHVLLVDDDRDTLELITAALIGRDARVTAVSSAIAALDAIKVCRPDVLVSDIAMPGEDGYELIQKVRALDYSSARTIPAVAITAYAKEEDRNRAFSSGFQGYLAKPVELAELIHAVAQAAGRN